MLSPQTIWPPPAVAWRRSQNAQLPVNRLPVEVLCHAFSLLDLLDCMTTSAVCHHWRAVAVHEPRLWATIDRELAPWKLSAVSVFLQRSKKAILELAFDLPTLDCHEDNKLPFIDMLRSNLHRTRALKFECGSLQLERLFQNTSFPELQELTLRIIPEGPDLLPLVFSKEKNLAHAVLSPPIDLHDVRSRCPKLVCLAIAYVCPTRADHIAEHGAGDPLHFERLELLGFPDWLGSVVSLTAPSKHVAIRAFGLQPELLADVPSIGTIDRLALVSSADERITVAAGIGHLTRVFQEALSQRRTTSGIPAYVLTSAAWMQGLTHLCLFDEDWPDIQPADAPALQHLTVMLSDRQVFLRDSARLYNDQNIFHWQCPSLVSITIGVFLGLESYSSRGFRPYSLREARLMILLGDILGFDRARKLDSLTLINVVLMDNDMVHLFVKRQRDSVLRMTKAVEICSSIVMREDTEFNGLPKWANNFYRSSE